VYVSLLFNTGSIPVCTFMKPTKSTLGFAVFSRENDATDVLLLGSGSWVDSVPEYKVEAAETILMAPWLPGKYMQRK
jgi:hypothetical protein